MPPVRSVVETSLYVKDLWAAQSFYERTLGFRQIHREEERLHAMAIPDGHVLLLFRSGASTTATDTPGGRIPPHDGHGQLHVAFGIGVEQIEEWKAHLASQGVAIESEVRTPRGGNSLYFRDPDGHLIELVTPGAWSVY